MSHLINAPQIPTPRAALSKSSQFSRQGSIFDHVMLQKILNSNIPTVGTDAVAAGVDNTGQQDATAGLQNILSTTGVLYLRAGTYLVSTPLVATNTPFLLIYCDSLATIQMAPNSNCDCLEISGCGVVYIKGIRFVGETAGISSTNAITIQEASVSTANFCWIERCVFQPPWVTSVEVENVNLTYVYDCTFFGSLANDILTTGSVAGTIVHSCFFTSALVSPATSLYQVANCIGLDDQWWQWPKPEAGAVQSTLQTITSGSNIALAFASTSFEQRNVWVVGSPTKFTAPIDGVYLAIGNVNFVSFVTGQYTSLSIYKNGSPTGLAASGFGSAEALNVSGLIKMVPTDYVEFVVFQNSGLALNTVPASTQGQLIYQATY